MTRRLPQPGEFYRHFKNKDYEIVTVARHSETGEAYVVYRALYGTFQDYIRPLEMFMSEVDRVKYPEVKQHYRFEKIGDRITGLPRSEAAVPSVEERAESVSTESQAVEEHIIIEERDAAAQELLMAFLNAEDYEEKIEMLRRSKERVTDKLIDDIGVVMDLPIPEGETEARLLELMTCLRTMSRYDGRRLRG